MSEEDASALIFEQKEKEQEVLLQEFLQPKIASYLPYGREILDNEGFIHIPFSEVWGTEVEQQEKEGYPRGENPMGIFLIGASPEVVREIMTDVYKTLNEDNSIIAIGPRSDGTMAVCPSGPGPENFQKAMADVSLLRDLLLEKIENTDINIRAVINIVDMPAAAIINAPLHGGVPNLDFETHIPPTHIAWHLMNIKKGTYQNPERVAVNLITPKVVEELWPKIGYVSSLSSEFGDIEAEPVYSPKGNGEYYVRNITSAIQEVQAPIDVLNKPPQRSVDIDDSFLSAHTVRFVEKYAPDYAQQIEEKGRVEINIGAGSGLVQIKVDFSGLSNLVASGSDPANLMGEMLMRYMEQYASNEVYLSAMEGDALNLVIPEAFATSADFKAFTDFVANAQARFVADFVDQKAGSTNDFMQMIAEHEAGMKAVVFIPENLEVTIFSGGMVTVDNPLGSVESRAEKMAKTGTTDVSFVASTPIPQSEWGAYFGENRINVVFEEYLENEGVFIYRLNSASSLP